MSPTRPTDILFLLQPGFSDPAYPGRKFYCWHCALLEGVLASFPELAARLHVVRLAWPRPRQAVVELVGAENQALPLLVLAEGSSAELATGTFQGRAFVAGKDAILHALSARYAIAEPHP